MRLNEPDWGEDSHSLAFELTSLAHGEHLHIILNAYWEALDFALPPLIKDAGWKRVVDTFLPSPDDFCEPGEPLPAGTTHYRAQPRSVVILEE